MGRRRDFPNMPGLDSQPRPDRVAEVRARLAQGYWQGPDATNRLASAMAEVLVQSLFAGETS